MTGLLLSFSPPQGCSAVDALFRGVLLVPVRRRQVRVAGLSRGGAPAAPPAGTGSYGQITKKKIIFRTY
ncbi:hypothetical protein, partial [Streptomyces olivaceus]|uniref:hypothetical protein n=1 Tax=Streptomyces olivaceus TaxID=47716 RepID=UPI004056B3DE